MRNRWTLALLAAAGLAAAATAQSKDSVGPMVLDAGFGRLAPGVPRAHHSHIVLFGKSHSAP